MLAFSPSPTTTNVTLSHFSYSIQNSIRVTDKASIYMSTPSSFSSPTMCATILEMGLNDKQST